MIEKGKISSLQIAIVMFPVVVATADLLIPAVISKHAGRDMWLSPFVSSIIGFLTVFIVFKLSKLYPKETLIQYSESILGRYLGKVLGLLMILHFIHIDSVIVRQYSEFVVGNFLPTTPQIVVIGFMIFTCGLAVRAGIEVVVRVAQFFFPLIILSWLFVIILLIPEMEMEKIFPIMENGIMPVIKGGINPMGWFSHYVLMAFMLPYVTDHEKGLKMGIISVLIVLVTIFLVNISTFLVFGMMTKSLTFPVMAATKYISIADFLEHIEAIIMAIWVVGTFIKISVYYYVIVLGTSQLLNLKAYHQTVFPLGFLIITISIWLTSSLQKLTYYLGTTAPFWSLLFEMFIPMFLLLIALVRRKGKQMK